MAADEDECTGARPPHVRGQCEHFVRLECVHARDADERRTRGPQKTIDRSAETQIGDGDAVAPPLERRGDVLEAERLDPEERTEAEAIVPRRWPQQQDVHTKSAEGIIQLSGGSSG